MLKAVDAFGQMGCAQFNGGDGFVVLGLQAVSGASELLGEGVSFFNEGRRVSGRESRVWWESALMVFDAAAML